MVDYPLKALFKTRNMTIRVKFIRQILFDLIVTITFFLQPNEDTLIQIEEGSTHIICQGNEELRVKIRDTLLKCLASF